MKLVFGSYQIRDWDLADAEVIASYANNFNIWLNLRDGFPHPYSVENAESFISRILALPNSNIYAIATEAEPIGSIGLDIKSDVHRFTAEMGYWLAEPYWGKGIMSQAVVAFADYGFSQLGLKRIFAEPYADNEASCKVLEKAGFRLEGTLKKSAFKNGKHIDQKLYAKISG